MSDILKIEPIDNWLKKNNWAIYNHQIETLKLSENGYDVLLVAPTGGGKTLAGFLPSLNDLIKNKSKKTIERIEHYEKLKNLEEQKTSNIINIKDKKKFKKKVYRKKKYFRKVK